MDAVRHRVPDPLRGRTREVRLRPGRQELLPELRLRQLHGAVVVGHALPLRGGDALQVRQVLGPDLAGVPGLPGGGGVEHRQDRRPAVEHHLPVGGGDGVLDLGLIALRVLPPVVRGPVLPQERLAAGVVRADVGGVAVIAAILHLIVRVGPGRHRLGAEGVLGEGGGHLRPQHPLEIVGERHLRDGVPVQHPQRPGAVHLSRRQQLDGLLRLLGGPLPPHRRHGEDRQQKEQRRQAEAHPHRVPSLRVL